MPYTARRDGWVVSSAHGTGCHAAALVQKKTKKGAAQLEKRGGCKKESGYEARPTAHTTDCAQRNGGGHLSLIVCFEQLARTHLGSSSMAMGLGRSLVMCWT